MQKPMTMKNALGWLGAGACVCGAVLVDWRTSPFLGVFFLSQAGWLGIFAAGKADNTVIGKWSVRVLVVVALVAILIDAM